MAGSAREELKKQIDAIEESYEFMLAYAAQGLSTHEGSTSGSHVRSYLTSLSDALQEVAGLFARAVDEEGLPGGELYAELIDLVRDDARKSRSMVCLTLAQPAISSQLVDNLNASVHLRALLTDVFLLDEIIAARMQAAV